MISLLSDGEEKLPLEAVYVIFLPNTCNKRSSSSKELRMNRGHRKMTSPNDIARRCFALIFLFSFLFNYFGVFTFFKVQQLVIRREIKRQIKAGVPDEELHILSFSASEADRLEWEEEGREFRWKGQMYDVVRKEIAGNTVHYYCINDSEETELFLALDDMVRKYIDDDTGPVSSTTRKVTKAVKSLKFSTTEASHLALNVVSQVAFESFDSTFPSSPFIELSGPPPKSV